MMRVVPTLLVVAFVASSSACPNEVAATSCGPDQRVKCKEPDDVGPPRLYVDPPFGVGFPCSTLGCDEERTLVVENRGGGTLRVSVLRLRVDSSPDFSLRRVDDSALPTPDAPLLLDAGASIEIAVRYVPTDGAQDVGAITFETSDAAERYEDTAPRTDHIPLTTRSLGDPELGVATEVLDFGYVAQGVSATLSVRVSHTGSQSVLAVGPFTLADGTPQDFHEPTPGDWDVRFLNPGEEALIPVAYTPGTPVASFGGLLVNSNDPVVTQTWVGLQGTAIAEPRLHIVDPASGPLEMGGVRSGGTRTRPVTVMNLGGAPLSISGVISLGAEHGLSVAAAAQPTLGALQTTTLDVTLTAGLGGSVAGQLDVLSDDPTTPSAPVLITGEVTQPVLTVTPAALAFGDVVLGWTAHAQTLTLDNTGVGELTITGIAFDVGSSPLVRLADVPELPIKLSPNEAPIVISVFVQASQLGRADAVLLVSSDSVQDDIVRLDVTGNVVTCDQGCPTANGVPDCSTGSCQVGDCVAGFHDADDVASSGCECQEDIVGNIVDDVAQACPGLGLGDIRDGDDNGPTSVTRSGTLHAMSDVDLFTVNAKDDTGFFDDDYGAEVTLTGPPGMQLCANFQNGGSGCGGLPTNCVTITSGPVTLRGAGQDSFSDDDEDVTIWVMWHPSASPQCGLYSVFARANGNF